MAEGRNEPSMDEILSSIKRIIADEDRRPAKRSVRTAPRDEDEDILELTEAADLDEEEDDDLLLDDGNMSLRVEGVRGNDITARHEVIADDRYAR